MFFTEKNRKKNLIVFFLALPLFCGAVFLSQSGIVHANNPSSYSFSPVTDAAATVVGWGGSALNLVFQALLLAVFTVLGWVASVAITLFEWVIKPENISGAQGVLNQPVVYEMWKFIRDFFNLFFILVLLYIAFKIVFQIEHDFKKTLLSVVLAALYINFSYPVTRVLIDVTNVPMYFFANQMAAGNGLSPGEGGGYTSVFSSAMSASRIKDILIPGSNNVGTGALLDSRNTTPRFLIAIVFMFLFSITLLVLAVMFVVRLVALVVLVIFSSVGFAASIVPGLSSYADMWWKNFWKYAFFGPAAMLMLLVSVRFFSALGDEKTGIFKGIVAVADGNVSSDPTFFAAMALFSVPIIMLWMAMGLAQEFSIAGASSVVGLGQKFSKWAGKTVTVTPAKYLWRKTESKLAGNKYAKYTKYLSPTVIKEAFKARSEAQHHEDMLPIEMAKAKMHDELNTAISSIPIVNKLSHPDKANYAFQEQNRQTKHFEDQLKERSGGEINEDTTRRFLREAMDEHNSAKALAAMKALSQMNGLDNIAGDFGEEMLGKKSEEIDIVKDYNKTMRKMLEEKLHIDEQSAMKHMHNFGENAKSKGDIAFGDLYTVDVKDGKWKENTHHGATVAGNFKKFKAQTRQDVMHVRALFEQGKGMIKDPTTGKMIPGYVNKDLHEEGFAWAMELDNDDVKNVSRKKGTVNKAIVEAYEDAQLHPGQHKNFIHAYNNNQNFRAYVLLTNGIDEEKKGKGVNFNPVDPNQLELDFK